MKIVVGLGNPGRQYAGTRHNVGFDVLDYLASGPGVAGGRAAFQSEVAELSDGGEKVLLVKPQTFMNLSGRAVRAVLDFYKLTPTDLLVVCDDYNLPLGKLRVRAKGSHGGQNGLRNIQEQLGTDEYPRLRMGIGQPAPGEAVDFVLTRFKPGERAAVEEAVASAAAGVLVWVRQGLAACTNRVNGPEPSPERGVRNAERKKGTDDTKRQKREEGEGRGGAAGGDPPRLNSAPLMPPSAFDDGRSPRRSAGGRSGRAAREPQHPPATPSPERGAPTEVFHAGRTVRDDVRDRQREDGHRRRHDQGQPADHPGEARRRGAGEPGVEREPEARLPDAEAEEGVLPHHVLQMESTQHGVLEPTCG